MVKASVVAIFNEIIVHNWLKYCLVAEKKAPSGRQKEKPRRRRRGLPIMYLELGGDVVERGAQTCAD